MPSNNSKARRTERAKGALIRSELSGAFGFSERTYEKINRNALPVGNEAPKKPAPPPITRTVKAARRLDDRPVPRNMRNRHGK